MPDRGVRRAVSRCVVLDCDEYLLQGAGTGECPVGQQSLRAGWCLFVVGWEDDVGGFAQGRGLGDGPGPGGAGRDEEAHRAADRSMMVGPAAAPSRSTAWSPRSRLTLTAPHA